MKRILLLSAILCAFSLNISAQKAEGLALTPPMGWNSYNKFEFDINEELARSIADALVESGLAECGYVYLNLDDGWQGERDSQGFITENRKRFPQGMKALADYVHSKGLKLGIYSDAGTITCGGFSGSRGHEFQDAMKYAEWGVDYLKYDWCHTRNVNPKGAYTLMRDALAAAGRPIVFSMCEWGGSKPWEWASDVSHLWRTTWDITAKFGVFYKFETWTQNGVLGILDKQRDLRKYAGPGHWNDPDMLEVGNGMTVSEDRAHFTMWCMLSAPLLLGNDVRDMSKETIEILTNKEVIALDQDPLGIQALFFKDIRELGLEFWFKPLENGDWAFTILNRGDEASDFTINWEDFNLTDDLSERSLDFSGNVYNFKELWTKETGNTKKAKAITVPSHDVVCYRLSLAPAKTKKK